MEDNKRKIIIIIIIALIILAILLVIMIVKNRKKILDPLYGDKFIGDYIEEYEKNRANNVDDIKAVLVNDATKYFAVSGVIDSMNMYIQYLDGNVYNLDIIAEDKNEEQEILAEYKQEGIDSIYGMLAKEYKEKYSVDKDYMESNLKKFVGKKYIIDSMFVVEDSPYINTFFVYGSYGSVEYNFVVVIDSYNRAFEIYLNDYVKEQNYSKDNSDSMKSIHADAIEQNEYNKFTYKEVSKENMLLSYYNSYVELLKSNTSKAYKLLDDEYRKERFPSYDEFNKYVQEVMLKNKNEEGLTSYNYKNNGDYTEYCCFDKYGRAFIFKVSSVNKYTVALDTYTIPVLAYDDEYESASEQKKAQICLARFFECINNKDYKKAYSYLNETYKQNNFKTIESFETYVKTYWYDINNIEYQNTVLEGNGTYSILGRISNYSPSDDGEGNNTGNINYLDKTFYIRLGSAYNEFEISF